MSKQRIYLCILVALAALILALLSDHRTSGPEATNLVNNKPALKMSPSNREPETRLGPTPTAAPASKLRKELGAGGRQWRLIFADHTLTEETRLRINYDLTLILSHLPRFEIDLLPEPIDIVGNQLDRRVRFEGGGRKWNNVLQSESFGCLVKGANVEEYFVPELVTDAYLKAIEMEKQNQAIYLQLDQFLTRMSGLKERPIENVRELFVVADDFKVAEAKLTAISAAGFTEGWGGKRYREPSILDVVSTVGTPLEKYGAFVATTYALSSAKLDDIPPLLYNNGQWRFLLQRPPT